MLTVRNFHLRLASIRASVRSSLETMWFCFSSPSVSNRCHLLTLLTLCVCVSTVTGSLLLHWLVELLKYDVRTATVAVTIYGTAVFILSSLIHPFRCAFTLIFPTLFTRQGRKLLLSTSVMIVVLHVLPNMAANIATLIHLVKCASEKLSQSLLSSSELINIIKDDIIKSTEDSGGLEASFVQKLHEFDHTTHINLSGVKEQLHFLSRRVQEDFMEVNRHVQDCKLLLSRIFAAVLVAYLFTDSVLYLYSYLTSIRFDNTYITSRFRERAAREGMSIEAKDLKEAVNSTSLRITKRELLKCLAPALVITVYFLMTVFLILLDYFLYYVVQTGGPWISNLPPTNVSLNVVFKVNAELAFCRVFGQNCLIELIDFNNTFTALVQSDPDVCEARPNQLSRSVVALLLFLFLLSYVLLPLEVYARRLRRKVAASFFQQQEEKRIGFLLKKIQDKGKQRQIGVFVIETK